MLKSKPTNIVADPFQSLGGERPGVRESLQTAHCANQKSSVIFARLKNIHGSDWDWDLASVGVVHHGNLLSPRPDVSLQSHLFMMTLK